MVPASSPTVFGTVDINTTYYSRIISSTIFTDRGIAAALIEIRTGQGSPLRQIHLYRLSDTTRGAVLLDKHIGEFHSATKIEAAGQELHVTMDGTVKTYQINQIG